MQMFEADLAAFSDWWLIGGKKEEIDVEVPDTIPEHIVDEHKDVAVS